MERREFLKAAVGGVCGMALASWRAQLALAEPIKTLLGESLPAAGPIVSIQRFAQETEAAKAVEAALKLIGGIDKVIKSGEVVVIKPNIVNAEGGRWIGRVTNSGVMEGVIKAVIDCGATPIVAEGTCEEKFGDTTGFAKEIGLLKICKRYGAKFVDLNTDHVVVKRVPQPLLWSQFHLARQALECDKFISVPVMKLHRATGVTLGMKNLVGVCSPKQYHTSSKYTRSMLHMQERTLWRQRYGTLDGEGEIQQWNPLGATIADLASTRPIDLVVVDGIYGEERNSPVGGGMVDIKQRSGSYLILAGTNTVAVDAIGAHIMRQQPKRLPQLRFASGKGLGTSDIKKIRVVGERLEDVAVPMRSIIC